MATTLNLRIKRAVSQLACLEHRLPTQDVSHIAKFLILPVIVPPPFPTAGHGLENTRGDKVRIFRAEKSYSITQGKWYFEFEAVTTGEMRVGWARPSVRSDTELGADELAYVFNGNKVGLHLLCSSRLNQCQSSLIKCLSCQRKRSCVGFFPKLFDHEKRRY